MRLCTTLQTDHGDGRGAVLIAVLGQELRPRPERGSQHYGYERESPDW